MIDIMINFDRSSSTFQWCMTRVPSVLPRLCGGQEPSLERRLPWTVLERATALPPVTAI